jgi:uncharacterized protein (DUF433 family)/DNA-binding transcriptional MerR regulator
MTPAYKLEGGVYSPGMTGALAGVSGQSVGQWARYGLIRPTVFQGRPANLYSYYDVAEAVVVRWLLDLGVTHRAIRKALDGVLDEYPKWPLLHAPLGVGRLSVDDRARLVRKVAEGTYVDAVDLSHPGQVLIKPALLDQASDMLAHGGWVSAVKRLERIEVLPLKLGGAPSLVGRRWTVEHVARLAWDDEGREMLLSTYGLSEAEIDESLTWMEGARELALVA